MWPFNILTNDPLNTSIRGALWPAPKVQYNTLVDVQFVEGSSPPVEAITLQQAKDWMKLDIGDDDAIVTDLITVSRQICEGFLNISLIPRVINAIINNSNGNFYLPYGPIGTVSSITDECGNAITSDNYKIKGLDWKYLAFPTFSEINLTYNAGYQYGKIPRQLRLGMLQQLIYMYQHRGDEVYISRTGSIDIGLAPEAESTLTPFSRNV